MGSPFYLFALLLFGCGDFWEASEPQSAGTMTLQRDTIDLMVGDSFKIPVVFSPDSLSNQTVWWSIDGDEIIALHNDTVVAVEPGTTLVTATSVSDRLTSSCVVNIWPRWYDILHKYPYDMVIYANITIDGEPLGDDVYVGAFIGDELRGVAKKLEWNGHPYTLIRVWSDDEINILRFRYYIPKTATMVEDKYRMLFTAHDIYGTPSNPFDINLGTLIQ